MLRARESRSVAMPARKPPRDVAPAPTPAPAPATFSSSGPRPVVAVFSIQNKAKLNQDAVEQLTDLVSAQLTASGLYQVVPSSELKNALSQKKSESYQSCYDEACQIEIGKEIAAEKTLATKISKMGSRCFVTMQLYDLRKSASEKAATKTGPCGEDGILELIEAAMVSFTTGDQRINQQAPKPAPKKRRPPPVRSFK